MGANVARTDFSWSGSGLPALDNSFYWLGVTLDYRQKRGNNMEFLVLVEPGLKADSDNLNGKSFTANAQLSGRYYSHKTRFWEVGVVVDRRFGDDNAYPMLAFGWKPDHMTEVKIGFPYSEIHARWNKEFSTYARIKPAGGLWKTDPLSVSANPGTGTPGENGGGTPEPPETGQETPGTDPGTPNNVAGDTNRSSKKVAYKSWQVGAGAELHWRNAIWLNAEGGMMVDRSIEAAGVESKIKDGLYWQVGMRVQF